MNQLTRSKKLLFSAIILAILLVLPEMACRILGIGKSQAAPAYFADWRQSPDGEPFWVLKGEGHNAEGMRDRDHALIKEEGVNRIACIGDSVTIGHGLRRQEIYPVLLESFMQQIGLQAEVLNIATPGWSTRQELLAYRRIARKYRPDHVFLGFCLNDVAEMQNNLQSPPPAWQSWLMRHSAFMRALVDPEGRQVRNAQELFQEPMPETVANGWKLVFDDLLRLRDAVQADDAAFSVIVFPFRFQLSEGAPKPIAQQTLVKFCRKHGIPCLDLLEVLTPLGESALIDESHLSFEGSKLVATALINWGKVGCMMCGLNLSDLEGDACPRCDHPR
ncbi:MAG: SGNH/GDSL hydrolase family protein [Phycisphaerae bacterium]